MRVFQVQLGPLSNLVGSHYWVSFERDYASLADTGVEEFLAVDRRGEVGACRLWGDELAVLEDESAASATWTGRTQIVKKKQKENKKKSTATRERESGLWSDVFAQTEKTKGRLLQLDALSEAEDTNALREQLCDELRRASERCDLLQQCRVLWDCETSFSLMCEWTAEYYGEEHAKSLLLGLPIATQKQKQYTFDAALNVASSLGRVSPFTSLFMPLSMRLPPQLDREWIARSAAAKALSDFLSPFARFSQASLCRSVTRAKSVLAWSRMNAQPRHFDDAAVMECVALSDLSPSAQFTEEESGRLLTSLACVGFPLKEAETERSATEFSRQYVQRVLEAHTSNRVLLNLGQSAHISSWLRSIVDFLSPLAKDDESRSLLNDLTLMAEPYDE